jgi:hypothetical protein
VKRRTHATLPHRAGLGAASGSGQLVIWEQRPFTTMIPQRTAAPTITSKALIPDSSSGWRGLDRFIREILSLEGN